MAKQRPPLTTKTVYPPPEVYDMLGERSPELNEALTAWAGLIADAQWKLEEFFTPEEWVELADSLRGKQVLPLVGAPGMALWGALHGLGDHNHPLRLKVFGLDLVREWAVVLLCRWVERQRRHKKLSLNGQPWWTKEFRQAPG